MNTKNELEESSCMMSGAIGFQLLGNFLPCQSKEVAEIPQHNLTSRQNNEHSITNDAHFLDLQHGEVDKPFSTNGLVIRNGNTISKHISCSEKWQSPRAMLSESDQHIGEKKDESSQQSLTSAIDWFFETMNASSEPSTSDLNLFSVAKSDETLNSETMSRIDNSTKQSERCKISSEAFYNSTSFKDSEDITWDRNSEKVPKQTTTTPTTYCIFCHEKFVSYNCLMIHMEMVHSDMNLRNRCHYCDRIFTRAKRLSDHMKVHIREMGEAVGNVFACSFCDKTFRDLRNLISHKQTTHPNEKPFRCFECGKEYSHRSRLTEHVKTHTNNKPFICHVCHSTYSYKYTLDKHLKTHSELPQPTVRIKPYCCSSCNEAFGSVRALNKHTKSHIDETLIACLKCNSSLPKKLMAKHLRTVHNLGPLYVCEVCKKEFSRPLALRSHMISHAK